MIERFSLVSGLHSYPLNESTHTVREADEILTVKYEDGKWSKPYYDCGGGNIWMLTYTVPFFGYANDTYFFKYVIATPFILSTFYPSASTVVPFRLRTSRSGKRISTNETRMCPQMFFFFFFLVSILVEERPCPNPRHRKIFRFRNPHDFFYQYVFPFFLSSRIGIGFNKVRVEKTFDRRIVSGKTGESSWWKVIRFSSAGENKISQKF